MNPYKVLGVSENATQDEIRKAYLALVKKYHPDRYSDGPMKDMANEKLKEINQAYELLTKKKESSGYGGGSGYGGYSSYGQNTWSQGGYWQNQDCDMCDWCTTMLCLNCLCNCGGCH